MKMKKCNYILRYYLPVKPYFDEEYTEKRFLELVNFCKATKIKAVMFYVALNPNFYYMPDSAAYAEQWRDQMLPYIKRLRDEKIGYQLNFQNFMGATTNGEDFSERYDWEMLVDHTGRQSKGCACPIGKKFRDDTEKRLQIWADTKPDIIWIDDDFRLHNHGNPIEARINGEKPYADFYCFCDEHIRLFNERKGTDFNREALLSEILETGKPSKTRAEYLDFLSETMTETASWIEQTVRSVSPDTHVALMTGLADQHAATGRKWEKFLPALSGAFMPILRPHFGPYREDKPRDFVACYRTLAQFIAHVKEKYTGEVSYCPEVENTRFTTWSKSAAATSFQLALSAFMGCEDVTLSLYDLEGGALFDEPRYEKMLKEQKPLLDKLIGLGLSDCGEIGVTIPISCDCAKNYALNRGEEYEHIAGSWRYIENYFLTMGVPCRYCAVSEIKKLDFVLLDGYSANFLSIDELKRLLHGNVFLDGKATEILCEKGLGAYLGVESVEQQRSMANAERIENFYRKDGTYIRIPSRISAKSWYKIRPFETAEILSRFLTPHGEESPAFLRFDNENGGKVAIYPAYFDWGDGFFTHYRVALFKKVIKELCPNVPQIDCGGYCLSAVKSRNDGGRYLFIANLSGDKVEKITIDGQQISETLETYQTVVFEQNNGELNKIGKTIK